MLSKFLDPKNDVAFRKIFGTEKNKDILIHFLNDVITFRAGGKIKEITFLKTIQDPETAAQKTSIVDILCKDQKGNSYIVEMQVAKEKGFEKRAQYYASKAYNSQLYIKGKYHTLKEVVFLAIANFVMFPKKKDYKSDHVILDKKSHENDLKDFSFTFLELPKFNKDVDHLSTQVEKWCYFFKYAEQTSDEDFKKVVEHAEFIEKAYRELDRFYWSEEEYLIYEQSEKYEGCYIASMEQKFDEGKAEGEKIAMVKMARNLLEQGIDLKVIQTASGLSVEEITAIQKGNFFFM